MGNRICSIVLAVVALGELINHRDPDTTNTRHNRFDRSRSDPVRSRSAPKGLFYFLDLYLTGITEGLIPY